MMRIVIAFAAVMAFAAQGGSSGVHVWKSTDIAAKGNLLAQKLDAQKSANEALGTEGNRRFMVAHREGSGLAEWHEKEADVMFFSAGNVTMIYGGTIVDEKSIGPGERRGTSIKGGTEAKLGAGDVLHIPAKVPHQMMLAPGAQVTYFVTKVVE
jgi:mannose-6-phosphate isomerase-like protein (cupin superfamily)